ncbi:trehalose-6-phosphate synthase [Kitasatospora sp. NPDC087861]|uniref:trehalose-6-phosphate synthase n=1 Tax=Kitasatospora sp. NPDC087861 TaxID=3364070 RepID=UPI00382CA5AF
MSRILVTDLDGTLLGGEVADRRRLYTALVRHPEVTVVFATGRGVPSVREVLRDPLVPRPRWIIADVGATVVDGEDFAPVAPLQEQLRAGWPGPERVRAALGGFPALVYQNGVAQDGRCSYHLAPDGLTEELAEAVRSLGCDWLYSADRYFDVLPSRADKGGALRALAEKLGWSMDSVLVAGDSLNDLSLYRLGAHGVIVGEAEPALLAAVPESPSVCRPGRPGAAGILAALQELGWVAPDFDRAERGHPLVVGYHRPPGTWTPEGWQPPSSPNGILPTLNSLFGSGLPGVWVAAAVGGPAPEPRPGPPLSLLPLDGAEWAGYFHRACKQTLWPVLMSEPERLGFDPADWADYRTVNARFAEHIGAQAAPGATVWLHDYNLWLVPGLLRARRPDLRIGLFHHTPFPPPEVFAALPTACELRSSLACLDWAGFHTATFAEHFRRTLADRSRLPRLGIHPLGIDRPAIEALARRRAPYRPSDEGRLVLSVERLDYAKAPVQKVEAIARLLAERPDLRGRLRFRLVCPPPEPGITAHDTTRRLLEQRIDEINDVWCEGSRRPIEYLPRSLPPAEVIDQYLAADVLWVTSLQDGMNLTAKEFIAAQAAAQAAAGSAVPGAAVPRAGVLVLSHHAGAATELGSAALLTDPHSADDLTATLARALALTPAERRARLRRLSALLGRESPADWAARIVRAIGA